jgi:glycosyltransferase involved in cell wall biosynthesis
MKVGIFSELYPPHIGGQEVRYAELAQAILQAGHSVDVYCIRHAAEVPVHEVLGGVSVFRHPLALNYNKPLFKSLKRAMMPLLRYSLWARSKARTENYDVMIFNQWPVAHVIMARKSARARIVLDWCETRSGKVYRAIQERLPKLAWRNIAVSQAVADSMAASSGREVQYIPSGIWPSNYRNLPKEQRSGIAYLGRLTEHKNIGLLIEAFERMKEVGYPGALTLAGAGPAFNSLKATAAASPYGAQIHLLGFINDALKIDLLSRSELLVIPSRREGFPRVVAEGMASGLPTATVNYPDNGTKAVVSQYEIGIVAEPTPQALADAAAGILSQWDWYSANCLKHTPELDWSLLVRKLLE